LSSQLTQGEIHVTRYTQRVCNSILPLSVGDTLPKAFEEWYFTEEVLDHEQPTETCELCGQEELRYHFQIQNELTDNTLWVGSQCILKFNVAVFEDDRLLTATEAKRKLNKLTEQMRLESCIKALQKLAAVENSDVLDSALEYYQKNKKLTPKFAFVVFWRLKSNGIDHNPSFFNINLQRQKFKDDLRNMETNRGAFLLVGTVVSTTRFSRRLRA
jgi:hypothetical protein